MLRDARAKISFDLEREGSIVVVCSRRRRMESGVARYKRRHSSFISVFVLSARARARARRPETQAPRGAWVSAPRLEGRETLQSSLGWWRSSFQTSRTWVLCLRFVWHSEGGWSGDPELCCLKSAKISRFSKRNLTCENFLKIRPHMTSAKNRGNVYRVSRAIILTCILVL